MAKSVGKVFEENFKKSCPKRLFVYRPPDAATGFDANNDENKNKKTRFALRSPADYFIFDGDNGKFLALELKSFQGACSFEREKNDKGIIHLYQIKSLKKIKQYTNAFSGFVLDFRKTDNTYFLDVDDLLKLMNSVDKKSFNENDMHDYCSPILIDKKKLKVNYRYDIEKMLSGIYACQLEEKE